MTALFVHGGVSGTRKPQPPRLTGAVAEGLQQPDAVMAVEAAIRVMEDDPLLNAGYGSVVNRAGGLELDAGIVDGSSGRWGAVACVTVAHPISLARRVLQDTPHVLVVGAGAEELGRRWGEEFLSDTTPQQRERWERARAGGELRLEDFASAEQVETVGAVALDDRGNLCAGSSTGGVFGKLPGRVGDAPILGAGIYASPHAAVVGTGVGEVFLETLACLRAGRLIENGTIPQLACEDTIAYVSARHGVAAGLLALDSSGNAGAAFAGADWAVEGPDGALTAARLGPASG